MYIIKLGDKVISVDSNGCLKDPVEWNRELCRKLAEVDGIEKLSEAHYAVLYRLRSLNGEFSDMFKLVEAIKQASGNFNNFKKLFPRGLKSVIRLSGLKIPFYL